jgi:phosphoglycolate phosphatase-like HAD superfamily hydrolase
MVTVPSRRCLAAYGPPRLYAGQVEVAIRGYEQRDAADVAAVFFRSVRQVAISDYSPAQVGCHDRGLRVVLASSADPQELKVLCAALDVDDAVHAATSAGDVDASKPAPDLVQVALEHADASPAQTVFIGDAVWDVQTCQRAGVPCIALLSGGNGRDELIEAGAVAVYDGPADLLEGFPRRLQAASRS